MQRGGLTTPVRLAGVSNKTTMSQVASGLTTELAVLHPLGVERIAFFRVALFPRSILEDALAGDP